MNPLPAMIHAYLAGVQTLRQAVAGLSREQLLAHPIPGKWSILEVVCHLSDFDPILAERMKRIIALDRPTFLGADENRFVTALAYQVRDVDEELHVLESTRKQMARILGAIDPTALARVGVHNERGEMTLERLLILSTNHISHHTAFIHEKRKALGLPA